MPDTRPSLRVFSARNTPLLSDGNTHASLAMSDNLWLHLKVYSSGGENGLHKHPNEDHAFVVLDGEANFVDGDGNEARVRPFEGVMIPKGALYRFQSVGGDNLVMIRIGAAQRSDGDELYANGLPSSLRVRLGANGEAHDGLAAENLTGAQPGVVAPGAVFAPD